MASKSFLLSTDKTVVITYTVEDGRYLVTMHVEGEEERKKVCYEGTNMGSAQSEYAALCFHYKAREDARESEKAGST